MSTFLDAFNDLRDYNACNHCQYQKTKDCVKGNFCIWNDIDKRLKLLELLFKGFKISAYHTRHNETGYELCIEDEDGYVYLQITEEEFNLVREVRFDD